MKRNKMNWIGLHHQQLFGALQMENDDDDDERTFKNQLR